MADLLVEVKIEERVATITLANPPANVLTLPLIAELEKVTEAVAANAAVRAVVITGAGGSFVAGADVKVIASITSPAEGEALALRGQALFARIEGMRKPVIAAIGGFCLGGGMELALACHLRVAGDRAKLGQPEINLGIIPGFGGTQRLSRLVGTPRAIELILTGEMINAADAKAMGLVNRVVPEGEVLKQAIGLAKKIASKGRLAVEACMKAICEGGGTGFEQEAKLFGSICGTADMREGISAFLEKRQPKFQDK